MNENTIDLMEQQEQAETAQLQVVSTINKLYAEAEAVAKMSKDYAQKAIEIALECGRLLIEQKKQVGHGKWETWCKDNLSFHKVTAQRYMGLARKNAELTEIENEDKANNAPVHYLEKAKIKNLKQAYIATGILPEPPKSSDDDDGDKITPSIVHTKYIDAFKKWYRKSTEHTPVDDWTWTSVSTLVNDLRPIAEIYQKLLEVQKKQGVI